MAAPGWQRRRTRIHEGLVGPRTLIGTPYLEERELRREYAAEIAPRTRAALARILAEVFGPRTPRRTAPRVLDLGAGTGAAGEALRLFFGGATEVVSVDQVAGPGIVVSDLEGPIPPRGVEGRFDVVVVAHVLNELFSELPRQERLSQRLRRVAGWCGSLLADGGTLIIVEPALRAISRELLALRDQLLHSGLHVVAPCFWAGPCPALARDRDWCHDTAVDQRPGGDTRVDFSYLVLRQQGETVTNSTLFRIVSDPLVEKGRLRIFGCGPAGRQPLIRLDRHRAASNAAFDDLVRGDVAKLARTTYARDGLRVVPETTVTRHEPRRR